MYAVKDNDVYVNLFMSNNANLDVNGKQVAISQQTNYPRNGHIALTVDKNKAGNFDLKLRIPGWVKNKPVPSDLYAYSGGKRLGYSVTVNGQPAEGSLTPRRLLHHRTQLEEGRQSGTPPRHGSAQSKPTTRLKPTVAE